MGFYAAKKSSPCTPMEQFQNLLLQGKEKKVAEQKI